MLGRARKLAAPPVLLAALLLLASWCYAPGLGGPFIFDDIGNIHRAPGVYMKELKLEYLLDAALSLPGIEHLNRPLPRMSFALNYYFSGQSFNARHFKITNLVIHLSNAALVFWLASLLLGCLRDRWPKRYQRSLWGWLPVATAFLWALHPIQLTSVLYAVQRMTSMAGGAVVLGLIVFILGRRRLANAPRRGSLWMAAGLAGGTAVGVACKENAVLLPVFALLVELFFFTREGLAPRVAARLRLCFGAMMGLMALGVLALLVAASGLFSSLYEVREFGPAERLLTQSRILFSYLAMMLFPELRQFALFHDDVVASTGLVSPPSTLFALAGFAALLGIAARALAKGWIIGFGVLWYLVGHAVESSFLGLELMHEHRNYVPSIGVLLVLTYYAIRLVELRPGLAPAMGAAGIAFIGVLAFVTHTRAAIWESRDLITYFNVANHPASYRAQFERGTALEEAGADVREVYAAYRRALAADERAVIPLMRLQRIVAGAQHHLERGTLKPERELELASEPTLLEAELHFDLEHLERLDELGRAELTRRLREYPVTSETMGALEELRQCAVSRSDSCPALERVHGWVELALSKEGLIPIQRSGLLLTLARLYAYQGNIEKAVATVERAFELSPHEVGFLIELAQLHRTVGDYDSAERILVRLKPLVEATGRRVGDFRRLREYIAAEKAQFEREAASRDE